jgi:hypothetical protein
MKHNEIFLLTLVVAAVTLGVGLFLGDAITGLIQNVATAI